MWLGNALARGEDARRSVDGDAREGLESLHQNLSDRSSPA